MSTKEPIKVINYKNKLQCKINNNDLRNLTEKECFRLMGFDDNDYNILKSNGIKSGQLYKMAGNSIVVDVLYYILLEIYKAMPYLLEDIKLGSFFSGIGAFEKAILRLQKNINKVPRITREFRFSSVNLLRSAAISDVQRKI